MPGTVRKPGSPTGFGEHPDYRIKYLNFIQFAVRLLRVSKKPSAQAKCLIELTL